MSDAFKRHIAALGVRQVRGDLGKALGALLDVDGTLLETLRIVYFVKGAESVNLNNVIVDVFEFAFFMSVVLGIGTHSVFRHIIIVYAANHNSHLLVWL